MVWIFLAYIIFLILYGFFSYLGLYHLNRFGYKGDACQAMIIGYSVVSIGIVVATFIVLGFLLGFVGE